MQVNRFLGGVSFLPLFAAETGAGNGGEPTNDLTLDPAEVAEHGDPEFADPPATEPEAEKEPEPAKAEAEPEPEAKEEDETEQLRKTVKALGKRVSVLSKEKRDLHAKLQQNIKPVEKEPEQTEPETELQRSDFKTQAEFQEAVRQEAARLRAVEDFNAKCNAVEAAGSKAFGDKWVKAKQDLAMLDDNGRIPLDLLQVALETDNPAVVLFKLGNDVELATELMGMTPIKRAIAMDKLAVQAKPAPRQQSKAPPPVDPIGGRGAADDVPRDTDSDEEWNRKEEARERRLREERRKRGIV